MKACILVNGRRDGIFGRLARGVSDKSSILKDAPIFYRDDRRKISSIFYFMSQVIKIKPDIVYVQAVAFSGCIAAALLKIFLRFKYIIVAGDDYYHIIIQLWGKLPGFFAGILEALTYKIADIIISLSPHHRDYLISIGYKRVFFLDQGVNLDLFKPFPVDGLKGKLGLKGNLVIGTIGSIVLDKKNNYSYGWEILEVIKQLKEKAAKGLIVGDGNGLAYLKNLAKSYGIENKVIFTGRVKHNDIPSYINCMDICFSTQSNNMVGKMRTPTKLIEYLACGKFVISTDVGYAQLLLQGIGALIAYNGVKDDTYPSKAAKTIEKILSDPSMLDKAKGSIDIAKREFDFKKIANKLDKIIKGLSV